MHSRTQETIIAAIRAARDRGAQGEQRGESRAAAMGPEFHAAIIARAR